jgi:hypothetical protein
LADGGQLVVDSPNRLVRGVGGVGPFERAGGLVLAGDEREELVDEVLA